MADRFPGPYVNEPRDNDPMVKRVNFDTTEIGARKSILPKNIKNDMTISHVGNTTAGVKSR